MKSFAPKRLPAGIYLMVVAVVFLGLLAVLGLGGCTDLSFYWQAGVGQLKIINNRRPIAEVLEDEKVPQETKRKLRVILGAQTFATRELLLPEEGHYRYYTDLGRKYVSWLVVAAEPLSLRGYRFCYPIAGCLSYRGYFDKADAEALAAELGRVDGGGKGLDVLVRPVRAYSTLGWFDDPVLNTFLDDSEIQLAGTIIHEQTHRLYFLKGETAFNESFATFVEEEGLRRYLAHRALKTGSATGRADHANPSAATGRMQRFEVIRGDRNRFREIVLGGRERLAAMYRADLTDAEKRRRKPALFEALREDYRKQRQSFKILNYDGWFNQPLNNAHLVGFAQYSLHVEAFRELFRQNDGDFRRFYRAVRALGGLDPKTRQARLQALEKKLVHTPTKTP